MENKEMKSLAERNVEGQGNSKLTFDEQVISKIVLMSIKDIDGITTSKASGGAFFGRSGSAGVNVEVGETEVAVDLRLILEFGKNAKDIYSELKSSIEEQIASMTGLKVVEVNVKVEDVLNSEDFRELIEK